MNHYLPPGNWRLVRVPAGFDSVYAALVWWQKPLWLFRTWQWRRRIESKRA